LLLLQAMQQAVDELEQLCAAALAYLHGLLQAVTAAALSTIGPSSQYRTYAPRLLLERALSGERPAGHTGESFAADAERSRHSGSGIHGRVHDQLLAPAPRSHTITCPARSPLAMAPLLQLLLLPLLLLPVLLPQSISSTGALWPWRQACQDVRVDFAQMFSAAESSPLHSGIMYLVPTDTR
jgi:hypothetical protein